MYFKLIPYQLKFKYPFKIAHTTRETTNNVYLVLEQNGRFGIGEAVFPPYQKEDFMTMNSLLLKYKAELKTVNENTVSDFLRKVFLENPDNMACLACLDMALNELFFGDSLPNLQIQSEDLGFESSYTIGLCSPELFARKIKENKELAYYKLKIDQQNYEWILELYPKLTDKRVVLDANQGFDNFEDARQCALMAKELGAMYLEQVFDKHDLVSHKKLKALSILPIIADESFQTKMDLLRIKDAFDGVNIKLMKCGGLLQAEEILTSCRKLGLKTVIGCMSDSAIGIKHAEKLASFADWVDLDGHLLNINNPTREFLINN